MGPMQKAGRSVEYVVWCVIRLNNTATPVCIEIHLGRTLSYNEHNTKDKTTKCPQHHHRQACKFEVDNFTNANTNSMLSRPLLFFCRILLSCSGNDYPFKRVQTGHTWQLLRHHRMSHTSIHQLAGIAPARITRTVASRIERERQIDINQQPTLQPCTICQQTRIAEHLHAQWHQLNNRLNTPDCVCNIQLPTAPAAKMGLGTVESLPAGSDQLRLCWRLLNGLPTGIGHAKRRCVLLTSGVTIYNASNYSGQHAVSELRQWRTAGNDQLLLLRTTW